MQNGVKFTKKNISLPISRVRLIMKSSPDVSSINQDALFLTTKATQGLAPLAPPLAVSVSETNSLSYSDLATTAEETETFHFLTGETDTCRDRQQTELMYSSREIRQVLEV
uniref:Chromatin accessibility complex protein 1 n=1 Tax=Amphiprion ocellaris TaxID=80972 RepID=A0AAQ5ZX88_AMPOC